MTTTIFSVTGMSCGNCVNAVSSELAKLPSVSSVDVDLSTGVVTVASTAALETGDVAAAVDEAGFELTGPGQVISP
jgi:copper chaperone CopZ